MTESNQFVIPEALVWEAYQRVKVNKGVDRVDVQTIKAFESDLSANLYRIRNWISSGKYALSAMNAALIPKNSKIGEGALDMQTISVRIAQTAAAIVLEPILEPVFHQDSYGYPPGMSVHNALVVTLDRCKKRSWLLKYDIRGMSDSISHELVLKALRYHCDERWVPLLVESSLQTSIQTPEGIQCARTTGMPLCGPLYPALSNLFLHYALDLWLTTQHPSVQFIRFVDDGILHCESEDEANRMHKLMEARLRKMGLGLFPEKTRVVCCEDSRQAETHEHTQIDFLGNTFLPQDSHMELRASVDSVPADDLPRQSILKASFRRGFILTLPLAISAGAYGSVLGVLASKSDVSVIELIAVNVLMFAGSSQFIMVEMWQPQLPVIGITFAVLIVNIRYFLAGASLYPLYRNSSLLCKMTTIHFLVDESWAITLAEHRKGAATPGFLLGSGLCLMIAWNVGTLLGHQLGNLIENPEVFALDFAFTAVFAAILVSLFSVKRDVIPWIVTIVASAISYEYLPGNWYVVVGSMLGAFSSIWSVESTKSCRQKPSRQFRIRPLSRPSPDSKIISEEA